MNRLQNLNTQFEAQPTLNARTVGTKSDDDVVLVSFARTAMTRAKRGPQRDTPPEAMLAPVLKDVLKKANNMDPKLIEEICIGNVLQPGAGATSSRMAQFLADILDFTPFYTIDRLCSSGLQSIANIANQIKSNKIDIGIRGGVESMSIFAIKIFLTQILCMTYSFYTLNTTNVSFQWVSHPKMSLKNMVSPDNSRTRFPSPVMLKLPIQTKWDGHKRRLLLTPPS